MALRAAVRLPQALVLLVALAWPSLLLADTRFAVVIGNADYAVRRLANPVNDAGSVAAALQDVGFKVTLAADVGLAGMRQTLRSAFQEHAGADVAVFYFAGHGVQYRGTNYLLPVDVQLSGADELPEQAIPVGEVVQAFADAGIGTGILIIDACRDNPFEGIEDFGNGLTLVEIGGEVVIGYAAAAGAVAYDGAGGSSPYTTALVEALRTPGLDIYDIFRQVRGRVREMTEGRQLPWVSGSIEQQIVLNTEAEAPIDEPQLFAAADVDWIDDTLWQTIRRSSNPADFHRFAEDLPESPHSILAAVQLKELEENDFVPIEIAYEIAPQTLTLETDDSGLIDPIARQISQCDLLAASDNDPNRLVAGLPLNAINSHDAIIACTRDLTADPDNPRLLYQLARALAVGGRWEEAVHYAKQSADRGYSEGYTLLAWMYVEGNGVAQNIPEAIRLWRISAGLGSPNGRANLGRSYRDGKGVDVSISDAVHWLSLAGLAGERVAADDLGNMYANGTGVSQDHEIALHWYRLGAAHGGSNAMGNIARLYRDGLGVDQDYDEAVSWYNESMELGNRFAPFQLARLYLAGKGVEQNVSLALALLALSGERGFAEAYSWAGDVYADASGVAADAEEAYYSYLLAIAQGYTDAQPKAESVRAAMSQSSAAAVELKAQQWLEQNGDLLVQARYAK